MFNRFYTGHTFTHCWYFRPSLWTVAPMDEGTIKTPSPKCRLYWCLCGCGGGVLSCVVDHILQEFNTLFLTKVKNKTKTPVKTTFRDWCVFSSFFHGTHKDAPIDSTFLAIHTLQYAQSFMPFIILYHLSASLFPASPLSISLHIFKMPSRDSNLLNVSNIHTLTMKQSSPFRA